MSGLVLNAHGGVDAKYFTLPGDEYSNQVIAKFKYENIIDENASQREGRLVSKLIPICEVRTSLDSQSVLVKHPHEMYRRINGRLITYVEAFPDQWRAFNDGDEQYATGTPIEELTRFGATPAHISMARGSNVLTIEALVSLQGKTRKAMGSIYNDLMDMANKWFDAKAAASGQEAVDNLKRIAELEAKLAALESGSQGDVGSDGDDSAGDDEPDMRAGDGDPYPDKTDAELRELLKERDGRYPVGRPSRANLITMLEG